MKTMTIEELNTKLTGNANPLYVTERERTIIYACLQIINDIQNSTKESPKTIIYQGHGKHTQQLQTESPSQEAE
jgi:hypothetical protein